MNLNISGILYITKWFHFSSDVQIFKRKKATNFCLCYFTSMPPLEKQFVLIFTENKLQCPAVNGFDILYESEKSKNLTSLLMENDNC